MSDKWNGPDAAGPSPSAILRKERARFSQTSKR